MAAGAVVALSTTPAFAHPVCSGGYYYTTSGSGTEWVPTNIHSDWMDPGIKTTYTTTSTGSWTFTASLSFGADAGVIFAKIKSDVGFSLAKTWTESTSWSYSGGPTGRVGRLMLFHQAAYSNVTKMVQYTNCATTKVYTTHVVAPNSSNVNKWGIQYQ
nr:hypothetical protein [Streptomyces sp. 846.5]